MTKIIIFKDAENICGFQIKGHSGYAEEGCDIVCSGISTAAQMTLIGLEEILNLHVEKQIKDGFMFIHIEGVDAQNDAVQTLLCAMEKTLMEIAKEYAKFVKLEVKKDVY